MSSSPRWKHYVFRVFMALVLVGLIGSTVAVWANVRIQDSDAWADTVGPLADDPVIQQYVVSQASAAIDRQLATDERAGIIQSFIGDQVSGLTQPLLNEFVQTSTYSSFWHKANRVAHTTLLEAINDGDSNVVKRYGNVLTIDLVPVVDWINSQLKSVFPSLDYTITLPPDSSEIEIYSSEALETIGRVIHLVDELAWILPVVTLLALIGLFAVAEKHGQAMFHLGWAMVVTMVVTLLILTVVRIWLVSQQVEIRKDVVDIFLRVVFVDLVRAFRGLTVIGLLLVVAAWGTTRTIARRGDRQMAS